MSAEYKRNKIRVFRIYEEMGVIPRGKRHLYQMHHIVFRSEGGTDEISNLYPLTHSEHKKLHKKIWERESG